MMIKKISATVILLLCSAVLIPKEKKIDHWKQWLEEVGPIMSRVERQTFDLLKVEEDRLRFKEMFWKARDPSPRTPANEYQAMYYRRLKYVESKLDGKNSDMGRIYLIMGKPASITHFVGHQNLVECQLWVYQNDEESGLVPFINLLFFKPGDTGWFELFHPGIHQSVDLLSPFAQGKAYSKREAYRVINMESDELAQATLSVIPGEVNPNAIYSTGSSTFVMQKIFSKPERDAHKDYIRNFTMPEGHVSVDTSTREIRGYVNIELGKNRGFTFLNFSLMPEVLDTVKTGTDRNLANIDLIVRIEDPNGRVIFQNERKLDLSFDDTRTSRIKGNKMVFRDFVPIIEGNFNVTVTYINKTTGDFFSGKRTIDTDKDLPVLLGFDMRDLRSEQYASYSDSSRMVLSDPRFLFHPSDNLRGMVFSDLTPVITLDTGSPGAEVIEVKDIIRKDHRYYFTHPLAGIPDGTYYLNAETSDGKTYSRKIFVLPSYIEKRRCLASEKADPIGNRHNYTFILGQEYFQNREYQKSLEAYRRLPQRLWNLRTLPVIAQTYYALKDYPMVLSLLERDGIKKTYPLLSMMANSAIELKRPEKAVGYLKELQKYQDTPAVNYSLSALYLSMGDRETAKVYHRKAKNLSSAGESK